MPDSSDSRAFLISRPSLQGTEKRGTEMTKAIRFLTMAGMGLAASVAMGAGPAQATDSTPQPSVKASAGQGAQVQQHRDRDRDRIVGYYRSLRACTFAGRIGERFDRWEDFDCEYVRFGFRRGAWALEVELDRDWHRPGHGHGPWGNGHGHGHGHGGWDNRTR
jgi:hypothetical protein